MLINQRPDEQWRPVPGSGCQISSRGRFKNVNGIIISPQIQSRVKNPRKRIVYVVKYSAGNKHYFHVHGLMRQIWPGQPNTVYDDAWATRMKAEVQGEKNHRKPRTTNTGRVSDGSRRKLLTYKGWERDPWDDMHLSGRERDYFSFGQYCPCL